MLEIIFVCHSTEVVFKSDRLPREWPRKEKKNRKIKYWARGHSNLKGLGEEKEAAEKTGRKHENRRKINRMRSHDASVTKKRKWSTLSDASDWSNKMDWQLTI